MMFENRPLFYTLLKQKWPLGVIFENQTKNGCFFCKKEKQP